MNDETLPPTRNSTGAAFPATRWSQVLSVRDGRQRETVLNDLCAVYWRPLYTYLRRHNETPADAQDLVQSFLARLTERGAFEAVGPEKGKLRTFLLTSLRNYLLNRKEYARAQRRGGGQVALSLDVEEAERVCAPELAEGISPELAYDRNWARTVLAQAVARLREEHRIMRKEALFDELSAFLDGAAAQEYEAAGARLGMKANAVGVAVFRMKKRLRELVLMEVEETVGSRAEAEAEMRELLQTLAGV